METHPILHTGWFFLKTIQFQLCSLNRCRCNLMPCDSGMQNQLLQFSKRELPYYELHSCNFHSLLSALFPESSFLTTTWYVGPITEFIPVILSISSIVASYIRLCWNAPNFTFKFNDKKCAHWSYFKCYPNRALFFYNLLLCFIYIIVDACINWYIRMK